MQILRCDEKVEDIEDFVGKGGLLQKQQLQYLYKGCAGTSIYNPLDYRNGRCSVRLPGAGPILVSRIEKG